jgi:hypothetical protein
MLIRVHNLTMMVGVDSQLTWPSGYFENGPWPIVSPQVK